MKAAPSTRYGRTAIAFHWTAAAIIPLLIILGFAAANASGSAAIVPILRVHVFLGFGVMIVTLLRAIWWSIDRRPAPPRDTPRWQHRMAQGVHAFLYLLPLVAAASGIGVMALSGAAPMLFGGAPSPLPHFADYRPMVVHMVAAFTLAAFVALHVAAGLYHQFYRRDRLYARMGLGRT